jgi:hypothetical protein
MRTPGRATVKNAGIDHRRLHVAVIRKFPDRSRKNKTLFPSELTIKSVFANKILPLPPPLEKGDIGGFALVCSYGHLPEIRLHTPRQKVGGVVVGLPGARGEL